MVSAQPVHAQRLHRRHRLGPGGPQGGIGVHVELDHQAIWVPQVKRLADLVVAAAGRHHAFVAQVLMRGPQGLDVVADAQRDVDQTGALRRWRRTWRRRWRARREPSDDELVRLTLLSQSRHT